MKKTTKNLATLLALLMLALPIFSACNDGNIELPLETQAQTESETTADTSGGSSSSKKVSFKHVLSAIEYCNKKPYKASMTKASTTENNNLTVLLPGYEELLLSITVNNGNFKADVSQTFGDSDIDPANYTQTVVNNIRYYSSAMKRKYKFNITDEAARESLHSFVGEITELGELLNDKYYGSIVSSNNSLTLSQLTDNGCQKFQEYFYIDYSYYEGVTASVDKNSKIEIQFDSIGRFSKIDINILCAIENANEKGTITHSSVYTFDYSGDLSVSAPEDADEYTQVVQPTPAPPDESDYVEQNGILYDLNEKETAYTVVGLARDNDSTDIVIAASVNGLPVTEIRQNAFEMEAFVTVSIPNTVEKINEDAFSNCYDLRIVTFAAGSKIKTIGAQAFLMCNSLESITIPKTVTSIGAKAFYSCYELSKITFEDGISLEIISTETFSFTGISTITIPKSVVTIKEGAFSSCKNLAVVSFEKNSSLVNIEEEAFAWCYNLVSIEIPKNVNSIGDDAFYCCAKIFEIVNRSSLELEIGSDAYGAIAQNARAIHNGESKILFVGDYVFIKDYKYNSSENIALVAYVGNEVFLTLPDNCNGSSYMIADDAFIQDYIVSINIPSSVTAFEGTPFSWQCVKLVEIVNNSDNYIFKYSNLNILDIHDGTSKVDEKDGYLFYTSDGKNYLIGYTGSDTELVLPNAYTGQSYAIYTYAFNEDKKIASVNISSGVTSIEAFAFASCYYLTDIIISDTVTDIDVDAFRWLYIENIVIDEKNNVYITEGNCIIEKQSKKIIIGFDNSVISTDSSIVTGIGDGAFWNCWFESFVITENITYIGSNAFGACYGLTSLTFENPNGWQINGEPVDSSILTNPETAIRYLTDTHSEYIWTRSN